MSAGNSEKHIRKVMRSDLCNRCGSCVGLSGGNIVFRNREGKYRPEITGELSAVQYDRIWTACSGKEFNFPLYRKHFFHDAPNFHPYIGPYHNLYIGNSTDETIRLNSASGGILSSVLIFLLETNRIDGAIVTRMSREKPWLAETFIATSRDDILEAAQSKYIITSVNEILDKSADYAGRLAYVGLPGQVQSVRKLQMANDPAVKNIDYLFGPFYGNTLYFSSVKSFLRSYGEKDYRQIERLYFRYGEWPGIMRVEMQSGRVLELRKFHANYLIPFHIMKNSLYCTDLSNEFTDISGGDAWAPGYEERGKGFSMVIARSRKGHDLLEEMKREGLLELDPIGENECIGMHSHGYDLKKRGSFIRMAFRKALFRPVPDYGYRLRGFPLKRWLMELLISSLFLILGTQLARWIIERFSPSFVGKVFERARKTWKKSTHDIKRNRLN